MRLDIRLPIGLLFSICGILLVLFGAASNRQLYERSLNININLWWGLAMLVFGVIMLLLGKRGSRHAAVTEPVERPVRAGNPH
jgi:hypothetical protein